MESQNPHIMFVAGEPSGDILGARLIKALKKKAGSSLTFSGVGGPEMEKTGLNSLFPMSDLTVMGLAEVLPRLFLLIRRINETVKYALETKPDVLVTIDAPDFCFRVAKKLKKAGSKTKVVHYVAPTVWAWRPKRAEKIAQFLDHLLCVLPFEPPYFTVHGLDATYIGHSIVEEPLVINPEQFKKVHNLDGKILTVLPGSRGSEVKRLLPIFTETLQLLKNRGLHMTVLVPTVPNVRDKVTEAVETWPFRTIVVEGQSEKMNAFAASDGALAASGTVTLELARTRTPHLVTYRFGVLTAWIGRMLVNTPFVNLVNLVLKKMLVPELLQENCTAVHLSEGIAGLLDNPARSIAQKEGFKQSYEIFGEGQQPPSERAAEVVLRLAKHGT